MYSLGSKDKVIREFCSENDIIIDYEPDDTIIGSQVLRLYNTFYQKYSDAWMIYSNNIIVSEKYR